MKMPDNNEINFILTKNFKSQNPIKYINIIYHHMCKMMEDRKLAIKQIKSSAILADGLIKAFFAATFKKH